MNIFQNNPAQFRRGTALDEGTHGASPALLGEGGDDLRSSRPFTAAPLPPSNVKGVDLPGLISAAQQPSASREVLPALSSSASHLPFPSTPYYGVLSHCEVHIDIAAEASDAVKVVPSLYNPSSCVSQLSRMQRRLRRTANEHGSVYHLGTSASPYEHVFPASPAPSSSAASASGTALSYGAYVEGMQDGLRQMCALRAACTAQNCNTATTTTATTFTTHHCFYMRLVGHPTWKDLSALLCVEKGRLLLCLVSSSRVTQKHFTAVCAAAGVEAEWLSGAALVVEPTTLTETEVNPVWTAWEALLHLPLLPATPRTTQHNDEASSAAAAAAAATAFDDADGSADFFATSANEGPAGVRAALEVLQRSRVPLRGCHVSLVSSLPFRGARRCCPVGRFTDEALLYAPNVETSAPSAAAASAALPGQRAVVARRYVWRLMPSACWVLPHCLTQLLRCLIEECGLHTFTVRCRGALTAEAAQPSSGADATRARTLLGAGSGAGAGVRFVHGATPSFLALRRGPSSVAWVAFSRLSGSAWVDVDTREGLAVGGGAAAVRYEAGEYGRDHQRDVKALADGAATALVSEDGEDEEETELEFELTSIAYHRPTGTATSTLKRPRSVVTSAAAEESSDDNNDDEGASAKAMTRLVLRSCVNTAAWGSGFRFGVAVKRLITMEDDAE